MNSIFLPMRALFALTIVAALPAIGEAQDRLQEAREKYFAMDDEGALQAVNEILLDQPLHVGAIELRASSLMWLGRYEDALRTIDRVKDERSTRVKVLRAECLSLNGRDAEALAQLDEILLDQPTAVVPRVKRAKILMKTNQVDRAFNELNVILRESPNHGEGLLVMGMVLESARRYQEAFRAYMRLVQGENVIATDPHFQRSAVEGLARVSRVSGQFQEAVNWYGQLLERFPERADYHYHLGISLGMLSKFSEAIESVKKAKEIDSENLAYRIRLAELYYSQKLIDEAIAEFEEVAAASEDARLSSLRLAELYLDKENLAKAISYAELVVRLAADSAEAQEVYGRVKEKVGDVEAAKAAYRKALEVDPLAFQSLYRLGVLLAQSDKEDEAAEGQAHLERYQRVSEYRADVDLVRAELNLNPNNRDAMFRMAAVLNAAAEYEAAGTWLERCMKSGPPSPNMLAFAGCVAANLGRTAEAKTFFQQALKRLGQPDPQLLNYIDLIEKGEALPLPLGELRRNKKD